MQIRKMVKEIDDKKTGLVDRTTFCRILQLHNVDVPIKAEFENGSKVDYKEFLRSIWWSEGEWRYLKNGDAKSVSTAKNSKFSQEARSIYDLAVQKIKTNNFLALTE